MPSRYDDPDKRKEMLVMVRFQRGDKALLDEAILKSGAGNMSAFVRKATWEYARKLTEEQTPAAVPKGLY